MARFTVTRLGAPRADTSRLAAELSLYLVESAVLDVRLLVGVSLDAQAGDAKAVTSYYAAGGLAAPRWSGGGLAAPRWSGGGLAAPRWSGGGLAAPRWSGGGLARLGIRPGEIVDPKELRVLLTGRNPRTGERIISASGSHGRRHLRVGAPTVDASVSAAGVDLWDERDAAARVDLSLAEFRSAVADQLVAPVFVDDRAMFDRESLETVFETPQALETAAIAIERLQGPLSAAEAGRLSGFDPTHIRRLCKAYRKDPDTAASKCIRARRAGPGDEAKSGQWLIEPEALALWMRHRQPPSVRICYDVTLTMEKSIVLFAMLASGSVRASALEAMAEANEVGLAHLDEFASLRRRQVDGVTHVEACDGLSIATFFHALSRADDPGAHFHNLLLNSVCGLDDVRRALEATRLFREAAVASHLTTAELRCLFAQRFGLGFAPREDGKTIEIDGITLEQIQRFSSRRAEIETALEALRRLDMPADANVAALGTRPAKSNPDPAQLHSEWLAKARSVGLTPEALEALCSHERRPTPPLSASERRDLMEFLGSADGATITRSVFTEADVMAAALRWIPRGQRRVRLLTPQMLKDVTTDFLCSQQVIPLLHDAPAATTAKGRAIGGQREEEFTTRRCVDVQLRIQAAFENSLDKQAARVPEPLIDEALRQYGQHHGALSHEQEAMVREWCGSGHRIQSAIGRPGTGKTHTCAAAAAVWSSAGFTVIGAAVKGEAARLLGKEARIDSETVAKRLSQLRRGELHLDPRTVLVVDESSTLSDDDLDALFSATQSAGCALRLVGDPAQHRSVAAGGMWAHLVTRWASNTPELTESRRLSDPADIQAAEAVRRGDAATAFKILRSAGQLSAFESRPKMLAAMLRRWQTLRDQNRPAPIVTQDRHTVSVLNGACQRLLIERGEVQPPVQYGHLEFGVGDEVIAHRTDRTQHRPGHTSGYVRNGARGTVTAANAQELTVDFDGIGKLNLPAAWVANGGVGLAYALTSHAVQGATQPASTSVISQGATLPELVVNITRGTHDNHVAIVRREDAGLTRWRHNDDDLTTSVARSIRDKPATPPIALIPNRGGSIAGRAQRRIRSRPSHSTRNRSVHSPPDPPNQTTRPPQPRRSAAPTSASPQRRRRVDARPLATSRRSSLHIQRPLDPPHPKNSPAHRSRPRTCASTPPSRPPSRIRPRRRSRARCHQRDHPADRSTPPVNAALSSRPRRLDQRPRAITNHARRTKHSRRPGCAAHSSTGRPQHAHHHPDRHRRLQRRLCDRDPMSPLMQEVHSPPQPPLRKTR